MLKGGITSNQVWSDKFDVCGMGLRIESLEPGFMVHSSGLERLSPAFFLGLQASLSEWPGGDSGFGCLVARSPGVNGSLRPLLFVS